MSKPIEPDLRLEQELIIEATDRMAKRLVEGLATFHENAIAYLQGMTVIEEADAEDDQG